MYLADYHIHSLCSPDGQDSMPLLAGAAAAAGLDEICFTDHFDTLDLHGNPSPKFEFSPIRAQYAEAQAHYGGRIALRLGMELGGAVRDPVRAQTAAAVPELDFVIGSIHNDKSGEDYYNLNYTSKKQCMEIIGNYLSELLELTRLGAFDVLGHVTYPLRYMNGRDGLEMSFLPYSDRLREIFTLAVRSGRGIELNTNRGNAPLPDLEVLKLYRECGGEIITLGSDAHTTHHVGLGIPEGRELLREAGFRYFTVYEKRRPKMIKL